MNSAERQYEAAMNAKANRVQADAGSKSPTRDAQRAKEREDETTARGIAGRIAEKAGIKD